MTQGPQIALKPARRSLTLLSREESGQDLLEYALLAAVLGLGAVSGMNGLASTVSNGFGNVQAAVASLLTDSPSAGNGGHGGHGGGHGGHGGWGGGGGGWGHH